MFHRNTHCFTLKIHRNFQMVYEISLLKMSNVKIFKIHTIILRAIALVSTYRCCDSKASIPPEESISQCKRDWWQDRWTDVMMMMWLPWRWKYKSRYITWLCCRLLIVASPLHATFWQQRGQIRIWIWILFGSTQGLLVWPKLHRTRRDLGLTLKSHWNDKSKIRLML